MPKKEELFLLIPENIGERKFKCVKNYKILTEYRESGVPKLKYFKRINFLIDCQTCTFLLMNIIISDIFI